MPSSVALPRILLVEDDPISRAFLQEATCTLPARVDDAASVQEALQRAACVEYTLWLIDAHLPDGSGGELLAALRKTHHSAATLALAHTASQDAATLSELYRQGFDSVICKPLSLQDWQRALRESLSPPDAGWDEASGLAAVGGRQAALQGLRELFLAELVGQHQAILAALADTDMAVVHECLHRLKASCGFVGAKGLQAAVWRLDANPHDRQALAYFNLQLRALLAKKPS